MLPEEWNAESGSVQIHQQETADYAVVTIRDPYAATYNRVAQAYHLIFDYLSANGFRKKHCERILPCFERVYEKDGITYMDVFVHCDCGGKISKTIQLI